MVRRKGGREVVYVERGGDASAKWLFWGAVLGAGLALLYAPRTGEETRRVLQRKLWKLRAVTEEKLDELAQQFASGREALQDLTDDDEDELDDARRAAAAPAAGLERQSAREELERRLAESRARRRAVGRPRGAARLKRLRPGGWHRTPAGFLRRTLQAADENNIPFLASALTFDALLAAVPFVLLVLIGLTHLAQAVAGGPAVDPTALFHRFFPPHTSAPGPRSVRARRAAAHRGQPEPRADLALRGARRSSGSAPASSRACAPP